MIYFVFLQFLFFVQESQPIGTKKIGNYYVDKTEILNIHWLEYIYYKKQELDESVHSKLIPDSTNTWYKDRDRRYEPITLITYEQAVDYCKWRSEVVSKQLGMEVIFRLPTESEWNEIADIIIQQNKKKIDKEREGYQKKLADNSIEPGLISRQSPKNKIYDLFGNVSEMTATKGIAKGANNKQLLMEENRIETIEYNESSPYIGFRCIADIKSN